MSLCHLITKAMKKKIAVLMFFLVLMSFDMEAQCAMCRAVLESEEGQSSAKGINNGIMYLMIFPYLLMAGVAYKIYKSRKKSRTER